MAFVCSKGLRVTFVLWILSIISSSVILCCYDANFSPWAAEMEDLSNSRETFEHLLSYFESVWIVVQGDSSRLGHLQARLDRCTHRSQYVQATIAKMEASDNEELVTAYEPPEYRPQPPHLPVPRSLKVLEKFKQGNFHATDEEFTELKKETLTTQCVANEMRLQRARVYQRLDRCATSLLPAETKLLQLSMAQTKALYVDDSDIQAQATDFTEGIHRGTRGVEPSTYTFPPSFLVPGAKIWLWLHVVSDFEVSIFDTNNDCLLLLKILFGEHRVVIDSRISSTWAHAYPDVSFNFVKQVGYRVQFAFHENDIEISINEKLLTKFMRYSDPHAYRSVGVYGDASITFSHFESPTAG